MLDRNSINNSPFIFSSEEARLLHLVREHYPRSPLWNWEPLLKIAALIDLYDGNFPELCSRNEALLFLRSQQLTDYCRLNWRVLPVTQNDNIILNAYRVSRAQYNRTVAMLVGQFFRSREQSLWQFLQNRREEPLLEPIIDSPRNDRG